MRTRMNQTVIVTIHYTNGSDYTHRDAVAVSYTGTDINKDQLCIAHKSENTAVSGVRTVTSKETYVSLVDVAGVTLTSHNAFGKQVSHQSIRNRLKIHPAEAVEK